MLLKRRKLRLCCFTLLELLVSMGVFAILMFALMQFFTSAQSIWTRSNTRYDMYDNARLALNLMATDLQCVISDLIGFIETQAPLLQSASNESNFVMSLVSVQEKRFSFERQGTQRSLMSRVWVTSSKLSPALKLELRKVSV